MFLIFLAHQKNKPRALPPGTHCVACDRMAVGYNYGVPTCNPCMLLFVAHDLDHIPQVCMFGGTTALVASVLNVGCRG